jgi:glyoxylate reductase
MAKGKKPLVVVTRKLPDTVETRMRELFDARLNLDDKPMSQAELTEAVKTADVLVPTVTDRIDAAVLGQSGEKPPADREFRQWRRQYRRGERAAARHHGDQHAGVLTEDTADMTMALILAVPRRLAEGSAVLTSDHEWGGWTPTWMLGHRIWGKRLGIIGMGRIGQAVARRARAFGLQVHYHNRKRVAPQIEEELEATYWESLDQMLARVDIISVNCPHTPATYHLLSARRLKLMRPDAYIVNTARGEVIDENALTRMIEAGDIAGAGLDVFEHEPAVNPKLVKLARSRQGGDPAAHGLGDDRGPRRHGREGDHQHPHVHGRPSAAGPRAAVHAVAAFDALIGSPPMHAARFSRVSLASWR